MDACQDESARTPGERLAASYVNFYIANGSIVMPGVGDAADERAKKILQRLFPTGEVIQIYARDILIGGSADVLQSVEREEYRKGGAV